MKKSVSLLVLLFFVFFGCENSSESDLIEQLPLTENITYTEHIKPIIDANCVACHSNPAVGGASLPMTNFEEVRLVFENTDALDRMNRQPGGRWKNMIQRLLHEDYNIVAAIAVMFS